MCASVGGGAPVFLLGVAAGWCRSGAPMPVVGAALGGGDSGGVDLGWWGGTAWRRGGGGGAPWQRLLGGGVVGPRHGGRTERRGGGVAGGWWRSVLGLEEGSIDLIQREISLFGSDRWAQGKKCPKKYTNGIKK